MLYRKLIFVVLLLLSACGGASATSTPAPTLTPIPATGTPVPDVRLFTVIDAQSIINYDATLTLGGLKIGGTFAIKGKTIKLVPQKDGFQLDIDIQIDGNSVTGANSLVVDALKRNLESDKFPYGHFLAVSQDLLKTGSTTLQTTAVGTVELHGQTRPISMPITLTLTGYQLKASGATTLDLSDFSVNVPTAIMKSVIAFKADLTAEETAQK